MRACVTLAVLVLVLRACSSAEACGPHFPNTYLVWGQEGKILRMPEANFHYELQRLAGDRGPLESPGGAWERTIDADVSDLIAALTDAGAGKDYRMRITKDYEDMRRAMKEFGGGLEDDTLFQSVNALEQFDLAPYRTMMSLLPVEFSLYAGGAAAYRARDYQGAIESWEALLALPGHQRLYRSTWASFMIGKALMELGSALSVRYFEETRALAGSGFPDTLDLAPDSLGWQAMVEMSRGDRKAAMHHYFEMLKTDSGPARAIGCTSLRILCRDILLGGKTIDSGLAQDTVCRQILSAWVVSNPRQREASKRWLRAVKRALPSRVVEDADRLAWAAYNAGEMNRARQWLLAADPDSPYARWVKAKLLLRRGDVGRAAGLLTSLAGDFPYNEEWRADEYHNVRPHSEVHAELGVLHLGRRDYVQALDAFLRGGYWMDAAYVAERVLTAKELERYVRRHGDDPELGQPLDYGSSWWYRDRMPRLDKLRYLLARRLARNGEWKRARPHYPEKARQIADRFTRYLAAGLNRRDPARIRAQNMFAAAQLARRYGMEMMGTEGEPDWTVVGGQYELEGATTYRLMGRQAWSRDLPGPVEKAVSATAQEKDRAARHAPEPDKRFHYRYYAAELMWRCAGLLPDNDELTARALYTGGIYLEKRDPAAADRFYKALVTRCRKLPIGKEADGLRWFPKDTPWPGW